MPQLRHGPSYRFLFRPLRGLSGEDTMNPLKTLTNTGTLGRYALRDTSISGLVLGNLSQSKIISWFAVRSSYLSGEPASIVARMITILANGRSRHQGSPMNACCVTCRSVPHQISV